MIYFFVLYIPLGKGTYGMLGDPRPSAQIMYRNCIKKLDIPLHDVCILNKTSSPP